MVTSIVISKLRITMDKYNILYLVMSINLISLGVAQDGQRPLEMHIDMHVKGGSLMSQFTDITSCINGCTSNCRAVDYNFRENTCWFHYDTSVCNILIPKSECTHYKFLTCDTNSHAVGATPRGDILDITSCINQCTGECQAVDFNFRESTCWHHTSNSACSDLREKPDCNHYKRTVCGMIPEEPNPTPVVESFPGQHALGGILQSLLRTTRICIETCKTTSNCMAVDFDSEFGGCWFHFAESACTTLAARVSTTHYRLTLCSMIIPTTDFQGVHIRGGNLVSGFRNQQSCVFGCSNDPTCFAVDFNSAGNTCWFHGSNTACNERRTKTSCTHYQLQPCSGMIYRVDGSSVIEANFAVINDIFKILVFTKGRCRITTLGRITRGYYNNSDASPVQNPAPAPSPVPAPAPAPAPDIPMPPPTPAPVPVPDPSGPPPAPGVPSQCGVPAVEGGQSRIVGGQESVPHAWPWQVTLLLDVRLVCGGSLIAPQYVVTAAHCVLGDTDPRRWLVTLGDHDLTVVEPSQVTSRVESIIINAAYDRDVFDSDIALLKLESAVTYSPQVSPVCLPAADTVFMEGMDCIVTGWGDTRSTPNTIESRMNQVVVPIADQSLCNTSYGGGLTENMICAGNIEGGMDSCSGDSGGPLACMTPDESWHLAGIVSFGNNCALPGFPGVYTRVTQFIQWIELNMT